jgi:hypothetical protein
LPAATRRRGVRTARGDVDRTGRQPHALLRDQHVEERADHAGPQVGLRGAKLCLGHVARAVCSANPRAALAAQFDRKVDLASGGACGGAVSSICTAISGFGITRACVMPPSVESSSIRAADSVGFCAVASASAASSVKALGGS